MYNLRQKNTRPPEPETTEPLMVILLLQYHIYMLQMLHVNYPVPTDVNEVLFCSFYSLSNPRDLPALMLIACCY